jgi:hypothetical protein
LDLITSIVASKPFVEILDLDQPKYDATQTFQFRVSVKDPNLANNETPKEPAFEFNVQKVGTSESLYLSAKDALIDDHTPPVRSGDRWIFTYKIDLSKIKSPARQTFAQTGFSVTTQSVNGSPAVPRTATMNLVFPELPPDKTALATTTTTPPTRTDDSKIKNKTNNKPKTAPSSGAAK